MTKTICSHSFEDTFEAGKEFAASLSGNETVALTGDLGTGKTVFVKGIAAGLEIKDEVLSPTFTILHEYQGKYPLYHFDVYRISESDEMTEIGYYDYIGNGVCIIEWAELIEDILPKSVIRISIEGSGNEPRVIRIENGSIK